MPLSKLTKPHDQALTLLSTKVQEGRVLLENFRAPSMGSRRGDDEFRGRVDSWEIGTDRLLRALFTTDEESCEFGNTQAPPPSDETMGAIIGRTTLLRKVQYLESIRDNLSIYDVEVPAPPTPQRFSLLDTLHPAILKRCRKLYEDGHYDNAIMDAFKTVEDEIRRRIRAAPQDVGVDLVSKAMSPKNAVLTVSTVPAEQEAAHQLYRGAIGLVKNPQSHRFLDTKDPVVAVELIGFASFLMRKLDEATGP